MPEEDLVAADPRISKQLDRLTAAEKDSLSQVQRVATWLVPNSSSEARRLRRAMVSPGLVRTSLFATLAVCSVLVAPLVPQIIGWLMLAALVFCALAVIAYHDPNGQLSEEERGILAEFGEHNRWIVNCSILQDGTITGRDRGLLWTERGEIYFNGHFTSFAIGNRDIVERRSELKRIFGLTGDLNIPLQVTGNPKILWVSLSAVQEPLPYRGRLKSLFQRGKNDPMSNHVRPFCRPGGRGGHGQIPPLADGPNRPAYHVIFVQLVGSVTFNVYVISVLLSALISMPLRGLNGIHPHGSIYLLALVVGNAPARFRAIYGRIKRDLQRIRSRRASRKV